jgi:ABC-2 type transport system ATP-binding protein
VLVEFKEVVSVDLISKLPGVLSVSHKGTTAFGIECTNPEQMRKQILQLSIDHNLNIVSLQSERQNLESVFKSYTT